MKTINVPANTNVVIYAYYNTRTNNRGEVDQQPSLETQLKSCRKFAQLHKLNVVGEYFDETDTFMHTSKPEYRKLLAERETTQFDGLVVYSIGTLYKEGRRQVRGVAYVLGLESLKKRGIELLPVKTGYRKT